LKTPSPSEPYPAPLDGLVYPRFSGIPTFIRLPHITRPEKLDVALVGVPFDGGTSYRPGPRFGPRNIRVQSAMIRPYNPVLKINPLEKLRIADFGDLPVNPLSIEETYRLIQDGVKPLVDAGAIPICVGGDHSILLAALRAVHARHGRWRWSSLTRTPTPGTSTGNRSTPMARRCGAPLRTACSERAVSSRSACAARSTAKMIWGSPMNPRSG
jgi:hypothetical protein